MTNFTIYKTTPYNKSYEKLFFGIYNDFRVRAEKDYNFELSPLTFEKFVKSIEDGLLQCILLLEDDIPIGFLVYTTLISDSIELNIIHCIGEEDLNNKRRFLLEKFIELNKNLMREKIITYPMLGKQSEFSADILNYGFKTVNTSVMKFGLLNVSCINKVQNTIIEELEDGYSIENWKRIYQSSAAEVIRQSFKNSSDLLFDNRFSTYRGCSDIVKKITENIYGEFLPEITKVLLYKNRLAGVFFVNKTNDKIANIPIAAILKKHQGKGLSKVVMHYLVTDIINYKILGDNALQELNASCDADNRAAVYMYKSAGFIEDYTYPTAYHSGLS